MLNTLKALALSCLCTTCYATDLIQTLSLEEKVGQLLIVHFNGEIANDEARILIQEVGVGGIMYYTWSNGLTSPEQVQQLSFGLQKLTHQNRFAIPLLIAVDQEGGVVARLNKGFTQFPGNRALGETGNPSLAKLAAQAMGEELHAVGVNLNFAPVVDVNSNPRNPIIGVRSFGECLDAVCAFGAQALEGYKQAGIMATLKHYPGHGDVETDSHEDLPLIQKSMEELERVELMSFAKLASSADLIMSAHLLVPAFDAERCSTLSKKTLSYLRDKIGFKGVVITDSLVMEGVLKQCRQVDEAAIQALDAGCDLLLLGGKQLIGQNACLELTVNDIKRIHRSLVEAVKSGRISEQRLNTALERVLNLKKRYLTSPITESKPDFSQFINTPAHQKIAQDIASLALKVIVQKPNSIESITGKNVVVFAPQLLQDTLNQTSFLEIGKAHYFSSLNPGNEEIDAAVQVAESADHILICSYNAWKNPSQMMLIQSLLKTGKPVILVVSRDPLDASLFPEANLIFIPYSPSVPSLQAVYKTLQEFSFAKL